MEMYENIYNVIIEFIRKNGDKITFENEIYFKQNLLKFLKDS